LAKNCEKVPSVSQLHVLHYLAAKRIAEFPILCTKEHFATENGTLNFKRFCAQHNYAEQVSNIRYLTNNVTTGCLFR